MRASAIIVGCVRVLKFDDILLNDEILFGWWLVVGMIDGSWVMVDKWLGSMLSF